jgi:hypothetical protein
MVRQDRSERNAVGTSLNQAAAGNGAGALGCHALAQVRAVPELWH